ncbi:fungal-specific transcription factor domain-domain-containing protein [Microdochium bolleyi]|uniref:Fungal-specific transcription factor domain-domain-containing protein n=1 Tax=Microdochium bolleyi TaxID=196109 RepID=A0A136ITA5_9PEZI|nr:fungal-specific transcription factor domain-domain-containing protein [Microdochium bolleyi]
MATSEQLHQPQILPSLSRACARCHTRKVKCDLKVPRCTSCTRQDEECNITECVAYSHASVQQLRDELERLRARSSVLERVPARTSAMTEQQVRSEADELGVLAIGGPRRADLLGSYVGSATGSTFARIFLKQLGLAPLQAHDGDGPSFEDSITYPYAALPPERVAAHLLHTYIARIHTFWPFLRLSHLRNLFQAIYREPHRSSTQDKFTIFIVLALAAAYCADDKTYLRMADLNSPDAYYQTGLRLFSAVAGSARNLAGLQNLLLLGLWMVDAGWDTHVDDLWHLSRYVMSVAIELGIHRRNQAWAMTQDDADTRTRTWWCIYNLERYVAVTTGRVLSVREHAIDAPEPSPTNDDRLTPSEATSSPALHRVGVKLFQLAIKLRRIGGRILESVYIARGADGRAPLTTFKQICDEFESLRLALEDWKRNFDALDIKETREHSELKVDYCQLLLIMHRPSPTFMIPSQDMVTVCSKAVSSSVRHWQRMQSVYGVSSVCRCSRQLHSILMVGLAGLYCDWQSSNVFEASTTFLHRHGPDVDFCIDLVERGLAHIQKPNSHLTRYRNLLQAARSKVYGASLGAMLNPDIRAQAGSSQQLGPDTGFSNLSADAYTTFGSSGAAEFDAGQGMESYFNQISGYFDSNLVGLDENLTIWHDAFLEEIRSNRLAEG